MSRVGKYPVEVADGVYVAIVGQQVTAKGKLGELSMTLSDDVDITQDVNLITVKPRGNSIQSQKMWGTARSVISNLVLAFQRDSFVILKLVVSVTEHKYRVNIWLCSLVLVTKFVTRSRMVSLSNAQIRHIFWLKDPISRK